ncbi:MAG: CRISPR-associated protein Cas4 [Verrucomicrobia bacterium]|nr:CRISPR-associated protein Cas4 [Cytophagales bacterium]
MHLTATHLNYYYVCHRKLWLFASGMQMEHTSDAVKEGKLIGETTYADRTQRYTQVAMEGIKIDFFDAKNKIIHETKKSDKVKKAHLAQVRYYQYVLEKNGITGVSAVLEYPKLRKTETLLPLTATDRVEIENSIVATKSIIQSKHCPPKIKKSFCKSCAYFDFCWVAE